MLTKYIRSPKVVGGGSVLELGIGEVPLVRGRTSVGFNGGGGSVIGQTLELGVVFCDLGHVEERDGGWSRWARPGGGPHQGGAFQSGEDGVQGGAIGDYEGINKTKCSRR
jgi:hypothetical protein